MLTKNQLKARDEVALKMKTGVYKLAPNPCLCGEKNDSSVAKEDRYGLPIRTVLCLACGLMRSDPYYDEKALSDFYRTEYRRLYTGNERATEEFFSEQRSFGIHIRTFLAEKIFGKEISNKTVFEAGCGAGGILEAFRENRNRVFGADFGEEYLKFGREKGLALVSGGVDALLKFGKADIVILNHTLEHLPNPKTELLKIKNLLASGGVLYIALPGIYSIHETYRGRLGEFLQNAHAWHFTLKTLNQLLFNSGLSLIAGNEHIEAAYGKEEAADAPEREDPLAVFRYLEKTKRFRPYYELKKFSPRQAAFRALRKVPPLYKVTRYVYRRFKSK